MAIFLAGLSALFGGTSDFLGGIASRRGPITAIVLWIQLIGIGVALALLPIVSSDASAADLAWGAGGGAAAAAGIASMYRAFSLSRIGVVAPISAVVAAITPAAYGLLRGERPGAVRMLGVALGILAIGLVSRRRDVEAQSIENMRAGARYGVLAGLGFGALFILLGQAGPDSGIAPVLTTRMSGLVLLTAVALAARRPMFPGRAAMAPVVASSILGTLSIGFFLLAAQRGLLSIVSVVTSMYPAASVGWARVVLRERLERIQIAGVGLALTAIALITIG